MNWPYTTGFSYSGSMRKYGRDTSALDMPDDLDELTIQGMDGVLVVVSPLPYDEPGSAEYGLC